MNHETLLGLLVALAAGTLIGLERQSQNAEPDPDTSGSGDTGFGGVRTFPLIALCGALLSLWAPAGQPWPMPVGLLVLGGLLAMAYRKSPGDGGLTSEVAALITYVLGALAVEPIAELPTQQRFLLVIGAAAVVTGLLSLKRSLHEIATRLTGEEIFATVKLLILLAVVVPLVPNRAMGPYDAVNPFEVALMVALIAGVGFVAYLAVRFFGARRGTIFTGLLGGLVSSTAVTVGMAQQARQDPQTSSSAAVAIVAATCMMFARLLVLIGIVDRGLLGELTWSLGTMCVAGGVLAYIMYRRRKEVAGGERVSVKNPFALGPALKFGALFAVILVAVKAAQDYAGDRGLYVSSVIAGTTDADAITLSVANLHAQGLATDVAALAITLAAVTNTLVKIAIAWSVAGRGFAGSLAAPLLTVLALGVVVLGIVG